MHSPDHPISLRPRRDFGATQDSVFDDPGDEKSWHASQRSESLEGFYEGREPSWYESAVAPLRGSERVLDIGCGPGLALAQVLADGSRSVLGLDRWPSFARGAATKGVPLVLHDLTLPAPFLPSSSFDGIFSHYVLNYMSPIGVRQVLRECRRLLAEDGMLLLYLGAIGLGSGDESQTVSYSRAAVESLLAEAGFTDVDVESSPNGRNTVARARQATAVEGKPGNSRPVTVTESGLAAEVDGELQLSAAFADDTGGKIEVSVAGDRRATTLRLDAAGDGRTAVCARLVSTGGPASELQVWAWRERELLAAESIRLGFSPSSLRIDCGGRVEHADAWSPPRIGLEPAGSAYATVGELPVAGELNEAERGAEGRVLVVEADALDVAGAQGAVGSGCNRFLIRRPGPAPEIGDLDRDWSSGRAFGVVLDAGRLGEEDGHALCLWAGARQALLLVEGSEWTEIGSAVEARGRALSEGPVILVDPGLTNGSAAGIDEELVAIAAARDNVFLALDAARRQDADVELLAPLAGRVLWAGKPGTAEPGANEPLRFLTERTLLMRMRHAHPRPLEELGRRPGL